MRHTLVSSVPSVGSVFLLRHSEFLSTSHILAASSIKPAQMLVSWDSLCVSYDFQIPKYHSCQYLRL